MAYDHARMRGETRRTSLIAIAAFACASISTPAARDIAENGWPPLPEPAATVLLVTGADLGYVEPRGCHGNAGGALYRPALRRWLADRHPEIRQLWLGTGNVLAGRPEDPETSAAERMFELLGSAGYDAMGVGVSDLNVLSPAELRAVAQRRGVALVSSNLLVYETGRPAFATSRVVEIGGVRYGILAALDHAPHRVWGDISTGTVVTVDPLDVLPDLIEELRTRADVLVLLSSMGTSTLSRLLASAPPVDIVVAGWSKYWQPEPKIVEGTPVLWLGADGLRLARAAYSTGGSPLGTSILQVREPFPIDPATGSVRREEGETSGTRADRAP
jgi:hypothetical protein